MEEKMKRKQKCGIIKLKQRPAHSLTHSRQYRICHSIFLAFDATPIDSVFYTSTRSDIYHHYQIIVGSLWIDKLMLDFRLRVTAQSLLTTCYSQAQTKHITASNITANRSSIFPPYLQVNMFVTGLYKQACHLGLRHYLPFKAAHFPHRCFCVPTPTKAVQNRCTDLSDPCCCCPSTCCDN